MAVYRGAVTLEPPSSNHGDDQPEGKTSNVRLPRDIRFGPGQQELGHKPDAKKQHGRYREWPKEERRDDGSDPCPWEQDCIGAHNPRDRSGGTHYREGALRPDEDMGGGRCEAGHQIENEIGGVAEGILDVVAENDEHPEVGNQVSDSAMEKDRGQHREPDVLAAEHSRITLLTRSAADLGNA